MVDFKYEKSEKCDQNFFFRRISIKFILGTIQTILRKKVFTLEKKKEIFCWYAFEREPVLMRVLNLKLPGAWGAELPVVGFQAPRKTKIEKHSFIEIFFLLKSKHCFPYNRLIRTQKYLVIFFHGFRKKF